MDDANQALETERQTSLLLRAEIVALNKTIKSLGHEKEKCLEMLASFCKSAYRSSEARANLDNVF